jgi:aspartyl-tRNA(Asn)/glutamyl-tRNA(Gln) amidotransferase subunit A
VEVLAACVARVQADTLGAWAALSLDSARAEAQAAEAAWAHGEPTGPLCGVPVGVKDLFDTAGIETAAGSPLLAGRVPASDALAVARCRAAGAVIVGKTRTHPFAWGITMRAADGSPVTRNPHDPERTPGGSSGGSAVAVAAGHVPLALGTDTGGSIRIPAAWCRITGFKPTHGRVPLDGVWPLAPSLDHAGPLAATAADCALALGVLDGSGQTALAVLPDRDLVIAGAEVLPDGERVLACFGVIQRVEALAVHRAAGLWPARAAGYSRDTRERLQAIERVSDADVRAAEAEREALRAEVAAIFAGGVDLIRSPVAPIAPPRWDEWVDPRPHVLPHTTLQDLLGLPACALPDATQLTGPPGADRLVLAAAAALNP